MAASQYDFSPEAIRKVIKCYCQNMVELDGSLDQTVVTITNSVHLFWLAKGNTHASSFSTTYVALYVITTRN